MARTKNKTTGRADSVAALARAMGVSRACIQKWTGLRSWPFNSSPPWAVAKVREWRQARREARAAAGDKTLTEARRRRELARAALSELELAERRGRLVDAAAARAAMAHQVACLASWLNSLPSRLAGELLAGRGAETIGAAEDRVAAVLDEQRHALADGARIRITRAALDAVILDVFTVTPDDAKKG